MKHLRKLTSCYIISNGTSADTLMRFIQKTAPLYFSGQSSDLVEATREIAVTRPDITFFDMGTDVPQWAELMDIICRNSYLIFISDRSETALSLYRKFTTDFMMAPISYLNFIRVVTKSQLIISHHGVPEAAPDPYSFYITEEKGRLVRIVYDDILYVQGAHNYIRIQLEAGQYLVYLSLKEMEKELPPRQFVRVHKSFIVNIEKIKSIEWNKIMLPNNEAVTIGDTYKQPFMELIGQRLISIKKGE